MEKIFIANPQDRRVICGILADNGYTVRLAKVKVGSQTKIVIEYWRE